MGNRLVSTDANYLFPTPLEARLAAKMTASVTDAAVASRINGTATGAAIDSRIITQATPLVQPIVADYIASSQVVVDAAAAAVNANPKIAELEAAKWFRGSYPGGDLFTHATQGMYFAATGTSIPNWPVALSGIGGSVEFTINNGIKSIEIRSYGLRAGVYTTQTNSVGNNTFFDWRRSDSDLQGNLPTAANVLDGTREGRWAITDAVAASIVGLPAGIKGPGFITFHKMNLALGVNFVEYETYGPLVGGLYRNYTASAVGTHTWIGWDKIATATDMAATAAAAQPIGLNHDVLLDAFTMARGGTIGVGDKAVVALRFDDPINGLLNSGVAAKLLSLGMPASAAYCSGSFTAPDLIALSNLGTWLTVKDWARKQGLEAHHHGGNHADASGPTALKRETVDSLALLQAALPTLEVNKWMQPGVGGTNYDGFASADKASLFYEHPAGKLILSGHAIASGYMPGILRRLDGNPRNGLGHYTVDAPANLAAAYGHVDEAVASRSGLCIMLHPNNLDRSGEYSTSTDFIAFLTHLAALRDAGKIEILTVSGLLCAKSGTSSRAQVVRNSAFADGLTGWLGTAGWSVAAGVASTAGTTMLKQTHNIDRHGWFRGGTMQMVAEVSAPSGAAIRLHQSSTNDPTGWTAERNITLTASTAKVKVRLNACVPLEMTRDDYVVTGITRVSGGDLEVHSVEYVPV